MDKVGKGKEKKEERRERLMNEGIRKKGGRSERRWERRQIDEGRKWGVRKRGEGETF